ncbi:hypothetical protein [Marivita sp. GX14005]|uniref:hypothetical protein n=1 Tax=Marivita sp. GX14005 TaxID=2942276 RepID=UPI00201989B1|nr:hypothetical protein [Marivita sp. GX14005]MCL3883697.1 hypothetical protein [Marivita sp. GX14005]
MKQIIATALAAVLIASPSLAEDGTSLMEEGARLFFKGLGEEMEPALREFENLAEEMGPALRRFAREMGPAMKDLLREVEDWSAYEPPVRLPNGDILLRRKPDPAPAPEDLPAPDAGEIDL